MSDVSADGASAENMNFLYKPKRLNVFSEISSADDEDEDDIENVDSDLGEQANLVLHAQKSSLLTSTTTVGTSKLYKCQDVEDDSKKFCQDLLEEANLQDEFP